MDCPNCGFSVQDDANFCPRCGNSLSSHNNHELREDGHNPFKIHRMFFAVFKSHSRSEAENVLVSGTTRTTPDIGEITLPSPWLFSRILFLSLLAYMGFYIGLFRFGNLNFLPGLIIIGAFITPIALLIFFWEVNSIQNISMYSLMIYFLMGGLTALLYTVILYDLIDGYKSALMIGFVEETAKILALLVFAARRRYRYLLNGMLIGAAIGTGFSVFETSGYILMTALKYGLHPMLQTIFWRAILAPGGHIAWASLTGAVFILVKGDRPFRVRMLLNLKFLGTYALVIALHALWDADIPQPVVLDVPLLPVGLIIISWVFILILLKKGVKQVTADMVTK